ncbi:GTP diphosphokinase [Brumicola pallidula]|uniref:GTP pyrophosphokinase n=1 Tax=Brumicola pallidula DSM 14239 = ACAM 615 TaxID=1121922 RepID=K6YYT2_9ALTE|nr:GTP diphosphokinase [Glaciecola pallidula]GAC29146.1 GTP pyrophosphokinase [Glaciecola pallidula DSM 14239 = ACAM 615]
MVSIRSVHQTSRPTFSQWLADLDVPEKTKTKLSQISDKPDDLLIGQEMVEILHELHMDDETLQAALVYPYCQIHELSEDQIEDQFGLSIKELILGVRRMDAIKTLQSRNRQDENHVNNLRRMLLSMVEDVRAVVIKMAERICTLHSVKEADEETRVIVAHECSSIYAPLANRLGIGQLKWELEDLSFRYLHPNTYKRIAEMLDEKRIGREQYIIDIVQKLQDLLDEQNIKAEVIGRPKHIYSIWKKMQKKQLSFEELFDIRALRIVADKLQDCYAALGTVHTVWKHIPKEFDDYIATPKQNGYQSIHTVIMGPQGKSVEIQIRTQKMHQDAELGVAAHWKYKEGATGKEAGSEERLNWLRKILQWQEEMAESGNLVEELRSQVFDDRVYVFTPKGDVIDLPLGSTPLDFAYYVHSNVGHRCIGAKVNKRIVPFTYKLQSGDQVEVLTGKNASPSRDWMHPGLGYVHSARARATIHSFFKKQDKDKNIDAGKELLERELSKVDIPIKLAADAVDKFNANSVDDLFAAVGVGDTRVMTVVNFLLQKHGPPPAEPAEISIKPRRAKLRKGSEPIIAEGVGNLLSQIAKCCQPVAGESILGYITQGKGVSVHKENCAQLSNLLEQHPERQIEVSWAIEHQTSFQTELNVYCNDRTGILRDITTVLSNEKVGLLGVNSLSNKSHNSALIKLTIEVIDADNLARVVDKLKQLPDVNDVARD